LIPQSSSKWDGVPTAILLAGVGGYYWKRHAPGHVIGEVCPYVDRHMDRRSSQHQVQQRPGKRHPGRPPARLGDAVIRSSRADASETIEGAGAPVRASSWTTVASSTASLTCARPSVPDATGVATRRSKTRRWTRSDQLAASKRCAHVRLPPSGGYLSGLRRNQASLATQTRAPSAASSPDRRKSAPGGLAGWTQDLGFTG